MNGKPLNGSGDTVLVRELLPAGVKPIVKESVKEGSAIIGQREILSNGDWITTIGTKRIYTKKLDW